MATKKKSKKKVAAKKKATTRSSTKRRSTAKPATKAGSASKGRPKGSATTDAVIVDVIRSKCPHCDSTAVKWSAPPLTRVVCGVSPLTKQIYRAIRTTRKRCENCGQTRVEKEYLDQTRR